LQVLQGRTLKLAPELVSNEQSVERPAATTGIRRTLLAIGFAVLVSMMLAPHGGKSGIEGWGPFFSENSLNVSSNGIRFGWSLGLRVGH